METEISILGFYMKSWNIISEKQDLVFLKTRNVFPYAVKTEKY